MIDAGISCREIEKRLKRLALAIEKIKAVFISHEHGDHIHGVSALSKKHKIPVYITEATYRAGNLQLDANLLCKLKTSDSIAIGALRVTAFPKRHDAIDPCSFVISHQAVSVGVFTDIGDNCDQVRTHFKQCHAVFLEANYDEEMLEKGSYPLALKKRIRNGYGHLSNKQAVKLLEEHSSPFLSHLFLSHLSRNNNSPEKALQTFISTSLAADIHISVAPRDQETAVYLIDGSKRVETTRTHSAKAKRVSTQLDLF